jgi:hypothetical protein
MLYKKNEITMSVIFKRSEINQKQRIFDEEESKHRESDEEEHITQTAITRDNESVIED